MKWRNKGEYFTVFGRKYENSGYGATKFQLDLMNPLDTNPQMFTLRIAYGTGIGFGGFGWVSLVTGTPMPTLFQQSIIRAFGTAQRAKNVALFASRAATPLVVLPAAAVTSAVAQREVWEEIGDPSTGAVHYSGAGMMTGGSMPVVSGSNSPYSFSSPSYTLEDLWNDIF